MVQIVDDIMIVNLEYVKQFLLINARCFIGFVLLVGIAVVYVKYGGAK